LVCTVVLSFFVFVTSAFATEDIQNINDIDMANRQIETLRKQIEISSLQSQLDAMTKGVPAASTPLRGVGNAPGMHKAAVHIPALQVVSIYGVGRNLKADVLYKGERTPVVVGSRLSGEMTVTKIGQDSVTIRKNNRAVVYPFALSNSVPGQVEK
jgi:type IV pilus biogenesis protein PilP